MKVLIAATALTGHINPLLAVGRGRGAGDDVVMMTAERFRTKIEASASGSRRTTTATRPSTGDGPAGRSGALSDRVRPALHRSHPPPDRGPADADRRGGTRRDRRREHDARVLPLLLGSGPRPPIVTLNVSFLFLDRPDLGPRRTRPPAGADGGRARPLCPPEGRHGHGLRRSRPRRDGHAAGPAGVPALPASLPHAIAVLPDLFPQPTVPAFEYDFGRLPRNLRFVGLLPAQKSDAALPAWCRRAIRPSPSCWSRRTLANADFGELIEPTLAALADRDDLLVVVTTGGRPVEALTARCPATRAWPRSCAVRRSPSAGQPPRHQRRLWQRLAGPGGGRPHRRPRLTEDKAEVGARIAWAGAGLNLATNAPTSDALRAAIDTVSRDPRFRSRAAALARDFQALDFGPGDPRCHRPGPPGARPSSRRPSHERAHAPRGVRRGCPSALDRRPAPRDALRLVGFMATLVLVGTTGLPWTSVARLNPQANDHVDPFIGI